MTARKKLKLLILEADGEQLDKIAQAIYSVINAEGVSVDVSLLQSQRGESD